MGDQHGLSPGYCIDGKLDEDFQMIRLQFGFDRPRLSADVTGMQPIDQHNFLDALVILRDLQNLADRTMTSAPTSQRDRLERIKTAPAGKAT